MRRPIFVLTVICCILTTAGCSNQKDNTATISSIEDSDYMSTFDDLGLGLLLDFDFTLPQADKRWVRIWVEGYKDGEKMPDPLNQLYYGESPNETEQGHMGFGLINPQSEESMSFLYAQGAHQQPRDMDGFLKMDAASSWGYAISEDQLDIEIGQTYILGFYFQSNSESIRTYDLQDSKSVQEMIDDSSRLLLLKLQVENKQTG
ncbi:hypothetical protein [Sediminibacillus massiliensis]|uniref:hypothetical protein n=1 Tax=Sediminibacillus massiliensis TaxID=1926277 RepID=UPI000988714B|nr:hypothetical protein [Sediminibacillus massiliensis]